MAENLHPESGARYLLERLSIEEDGEGARYLASIFTPSERIDRQAFLRADGSVDFDDPQPADDKRAKRLASHAKQVARNAGKRKGDGLPPWPARVLRWRAD